MKKIIFLFFLTLNLALTSSTINAQNIGTKKDLRNYKSELKAPDFLVLLKKAKQSTKKDSSEVYVFNGFSNENIQKCSFDVYKFKRRIYKDEYTQYEYLDTVSAIQYIYQNQKIRYKEIWLKKNGRFGLITEIVYNNDGQPISMFSKTAKTEWYFDKKGNITKKVDLSHYEDEEKKLFVIDNSKFTLEKHLQIREDLKKIIRNNSFIDGSNSYNDYDIKDWKTLNKTKKYLKKLFNIDFDLYFNGMSDLSQETYFVSEYGEFYFLTPYWKELKEQQEYYNKK
jgi:hypothetical protein